MAQLSPETIEQARKLCEVLSNALAIAEADAEAGGELPEVPDFILKVDPIVQPSETVAEAVAQSQEAREKFARETAAKRSAALALSVAAEIGRILIPNLSGLLRLMMVPLVLLLSAATGCAQPGAVQVGSTSRPAAELAAEIVAPIEAPILSPSLAVNGQSSIVNRQSTSQPASTTIGDQTAGRDARPIVINPNVSGSAWPIVAVAAIVMAGLASIAYVRATARAGDSGRRELTAAHNVDRAIREFGELHGNATAVADAIRDLGPGPQRDRLLTLIKERLPVPAAWESVVRWNRVSRSDAAAGEKSTDAGGVVTENAANAPRC